MKQIHVIIISLLCASTAYPQQSAKEAIEYAEGIALSVTPTDACFIFPDEVVIYTIDDFYDAAGLTAPGLRDPFAMAPGTHSLLAAWFQKIRKRDGKTVSFNFEAGKAYRVYYDRDSGEFGVAEIDATAVLGDVSIKYISVLPAIGAGFPVGQHSYLKGNVEIDGIDGVDNSTNGGLLTSGKHTVSVRAYDSKASSARYARFHTADPQFDFKAGKSYSIEYNYDGDKGFYLREDADNKIEYIAGLLNGPAERRLDGTWNGTTKRLTTSYNMQCTISGDRMTFESSLGKNLFVVEGRLFYNDNTIVLIPEKATANGKDAINYGFRAKISEIDKLPRFVWYYTLTDGVLHLESNTKFNSGARMWENDGDFRKTN